MTLLIASLQEDKGIFLSDIRVSSNSIQTDEMNKFFKLSTINTKVMFFTAGNVQAWQAIKDLADVDQLFFQKNLNEIKAGFNNLITQEAFKKLQSTLKLEELGSGGFVIHHDISTNIFNFYIVEFSIGEGIVINPLTNRTYVLGSGASNLRGISNELHAKTWSNPDYDLSTRKNILKNEIESKVDPLHIQSNFYAEKSVSEVLTVHLFENNGLALVSEEILEGKAVNNHYIKEQYITLDHAQDGSSTITTSLDQKSTKIKKFGENLDRDGVLIKKVR